MSKAKKNLIIIGSIVGVLVLLIILFSTLFSLKNIKVDYLTSTNRLEFYTKEDIIKEAGLKKGKNVVFADYSVNEERLEKAFPYAKFNIVKTFPNTAIIYVYERTPVFRYLSDDNLWYIFDEELKCLEVVAPININENNNNEVPELLTQPLEIDVKAGEFLNNNQLKNKVKSIIDGIYGFEATPISVMSHITLSNDDILETQVISMKVKNGGATIIIQGESLIKEKIAYALNVYISSVSQNQEYFGKLDKVTITVYQDFTMNNKHIVVNDGTN